MAKQKDEQQRSEQQKEIERQFEEVGAWVFVLICLSAFFLFQFLRGCGG